VLSQTNFPDYSRNKLVKLVFLVLLSIVFFQLSVKYKIDNTPAVRPLFMTGVISLLALLGLSVFLAHKKRIHISFLNVGLIGLFFVFYLYAFMSSVYVGNVRESKDILYALCFDFGFIILFSVWMQVIYRNEPERFIELLMKVFMWFGFVATIVALLVFFRIVHFEIGSYQLAQSLYAPTRIHGFMGDPSHYGGIAAIGLISLFMLSQWSVIKSKFLLTILYLTYFIGLIMSGSRASWLGIFFCMLFYMLINSKKFVLYSIRISLFLVPALFITFGFYSIEIVDMLGDYIEKTFRLTGVSDKDDRLVIWARVISILADQPLLNMLVGSGAGFIESLGGSTFNVLLRVTINYGFIFSFSLFLFYMIIFAKLVLGLNKNLRLYLFPCLALIFNFVYSQFIDVFMNKTFHFVNLMLVLALLVSALRSRSMQKRKNIVVVEENNNELGLER